MSCIPTVVTTTQLQDLISGGIPADTYKVIDPMGQSNPIFLRYGIDGAWHDQKISIYNSTLNETTYCDIAYDPIRDIITYIEEYEWGLIARQQEQSTDPLPNAVSEIISVIQNRSVNPDLYSLNLGCCEIHIFDHSSVLHAIYGSTVYDQAIIKIGESAVAAFVWSIVWYKSRLTLKDNSSFMNSIVYNNCEVTIGEGTIIDGGRFYDGVIISIPAGKDYGATTKSWEAKPGWNTFEDQIDIGTDTTPDMSLVAWAGEIEIYCTSSSITLLNMTNLGSFMSYKFTAAPGKTITFTNGAFFKCKDGTNVEITGKDFVTFKIVDGVAYQQNSMKYS